MKNAPIIACQFAKRGAEARPELAAAAVPKRSTRAPRRLLVQAAALIMLAESSANGQDLRQNAPIQEWGARGAVPPEGSPVQLQLSYGSDSQFLVSGGVRPGGDYVGRLGLIADADLEQLVGWDGAVAHLSIHLIHGQGLSAHRIGNLLTVSGLEAEPALRLFNLWVEQKIGPKASLRIGQFTAAQEFAISDSAALFVNSTFGWPASFAVDLPSGGPAYPLGAPGVRFQFAPRDGDAVRIALFAGDPAGSGRGDPQRRDRHGFNGFRLAGRPFLIGEVKHQVGSTSVRIGGWHHFADFADLRDGAGGSLANPGASRVPLEHPGNSALYAIVDGGLWQPAGQTHRGLNAFARISISPSTSNLIDRYADAGLVLTAPFGKRPQDVIGIGLAYAHISKDARGSASDPIGFNLGSRRLPDHEAVAELSYQLAIANAAFVQPNIQYILHPAGAAALPGRRVQDALVVGVRMSMRINILEQQPKRAR